MKRQGMATTRGFASHTKRCGLGAAALLLAGAAHPATSPGDATTQIMRFIDVNRKYWPLDKPYHTNISDLYTRVIVSAEGGDDPEGSTADNKSSSYERSYRLEKRNWFYRLVQERNISIVESAKVEVKEPDITTNVNMFTVTHDSSSGKGDIFTTTYTSTDFSSPLFRIGPNTEMVIDLKEDVTDSRKSAAAALLVKAVTTAVNIASPTSTILTGQSKTDIANASAAIDAGLSGLASQEITEEIALGKLVDMYKPGAHLEVSGKIPAGLVRDDSDDQQLKAAGGSSAQSASDVYRARFGDKTIGKWRITLECPRPSVFDPRTLCKVEDDQDGVYEKPSYFESDLVITDPKAAPSLDFTSEVAQRTEDMQWEIMKYINGKENLVLQSRLSSQVSIQDFIQKQPWYTQFISFGPGPIVAAPEVAAVAAAAAASKPTSPSAANDTSAPPAPSPPIAKAAKAKVTAPKGPTEDETRSMCANALSALYLQGLNEFDSEIVLLSMDRAMPGIENRSVGRFCKDLVRNIYVQEFIAPSPVKSTPKATGAKSPAHPA